MEALNQGREYIYYRSQIGPARPIDDFRLISTMDRAHIFINNKLQQIQYDLEIGQKESLVLEAPNNELGILVENMGRVNYGHKLLSPTQQKGIRTGVAADLHFIIDWKQYCLDFEDISSIDYSKQFVEGQPSFYQYEITIDDLADTYIDTSGFGKGIVFLGKVK